jgi:hypothetical protein
MYSNYVSKIVAAGVIEYERLFNEFVNRLVYTMNISSLFLCGVTLR